MEANSDLNDTDPETIVEMNSNAPTPVMRTVAETDPPETLLEPSERNREEESLSIICSLIDSPLLLEATARNGMEETLPVSNSHNDSPSESHGSYSNMTEEITEISKGERFSHPSPDETYDVFEDDRNEPESRQKNVAVTTNHHFPFNQGLDDSAETRNGHQESSISTRAQPHIESLEVAVESVKTHKTNMSCLKEEQTLRNQPLPLQRKESTRLPISEKELNNTLVSNTTDLNRNEINPKVNQSNLRHRDAPIGDNAASRPKNNLPIRDLENEVSVERSNGSHIRKKQRPIQSYPKGCYDQTLNGKPVRNPVDMSDGGLNHLLDGRVAQSRLITSVSAEDNASVNLLNQRHFRTRRRWTRRRIDGPPSNDEDSDGGRGGEMIRRLFDALTLVFHPMDISELQRHGQPWATQRERLGLTERDVAFINRFFEINGFHFIFRERNVFHFMVGNRSNIEVVDSLHGLKDRLKHIFFSRFCGEVVNGRKITRPQDLLLSFGIRVINGSIPGTPSTCMFI